MLRLNPFTQAMFETHFPVPSFGIAFIAVAAKSSSLLAPPVLLTAGKIEITAQNGQHLFFVTKRSRYFPDGGISLLSTRCAQINNPNVQTPCGCPESENRYSPRLNFFPKHLAKLAQKGMFDEYGYPLVLRSPCDQNIFNPSVLLWA